MVSIDIYGVMALVSGVESDKANGYQQSRHKTETNRSLFVIKKSTFQSVIIKPSLEISKREKSKPIGRYGT